MGDFAFQLPNLRTRRGQFSLLCAVLGLKAAQFFGILGERSLGLLERIA